MYSLSQSARSVRDTLRLIWSHPLTARNRSGAIARWLRWQVGSILKKDLRTAHIPVVACTAYGQEHRHELETAGFQQFVPKPCSPEELRIVLEELLVDRHT